MVRVLRQATAPTEDCLPPRWRGCTFPLVLRLSRRWCVDVAIARPQPGRYFDTYVGEHQLQFRLTDFYDFPKETNALRTLPLLTLSSSALSSLSANTKKLAGDQGSFAGRFRVVWEARAKKCVRFEDRTEDASLGLVGQHRTPWQQRYPVL